MWISFHKLLFLITKFITLIQDVIIISTFTYKIPQFPIYKFEKEIMYSHFFLIL